MKIQNFNQPESTSPAPSAAETVVNETPEDRQSVEIALLKAQVEHLELVVETARSLMTSNQERLLRRLHDLPREMAALAARLDRLDNGAASGSALERMRGSLRRVV